MALEYHNTPLPPKNPSSKGEKKNFCVATASKIIFLD